MSRLPDFQDDLLRAGEGWHRPRARVTRAARSTGKVAAPLVLVVVVAIAALSAGGDDTEVPRPAAPGAVFEYRVPSAAMLPTYPVGARVAIDPDAAPQVGDVVLVHPPEAADGPRACAVAAPARSMCATPGTARADTPYLERIVAGPGDTVALVGGTAVVNGERADEPFALACGPDGACDFPVPVTVPAGTYFVLGDNRDVANDSRYWGPVPEAWIAGLAQ